MANVGGAEISGHATEFKLSLSLSFDSVILKYKQFPPPPHSFVFFALCFDSLSCWSILYIFSINVDVWLTGPVFPVMATIFPVSPAEKQP